MRVDPNSMPSIALPDLISSAIAFFSIAYLP
jgi:hypothetical protein